MLGCFVFVGIIAGLMTAFLRFHIRLVSHNLTTIENLEKKGILDKLRNKSGSTEEERRNLVRHPFDVGNKENWESVFGTNKLLWALPLQLGSGKPVGDGIYWPSPKPAAEPVITL